MPNSYAYCLISLMSFLDDTEYHVTSVLATSWETLDTHGFFLACNEG